MPIFFYTRHLNQRYYRRFIRTVLYHNFKRPYVDQIHSILEQYDIEIHPLPVPTQWSDHYKLQEGQRLNPKIPAGVTGKWHMRVWIHDEQNNVRKRMENFERIQHELGHVMLDYLFGNYRRSRDKRNFRTAEVHRRLKKRDQMKKIVFWFFYVSWRPLWMRIIDVSDLVQKQEKFHRHV